MISSSYLYPADVFNPSGCFIIIIINEKDLK